jgi:hypothetical protein
VQPLIDVRSAQKSQLRHMNCTGGLHGWAEFERDGLLR